MKHFKPYRIESEKDDIRERAKAQLSGAADVLNRFFSSLPDELTDIENIEKDIVDMLVHGEIEKTTRKYLMELTPVPAGVMPEKWVDMIEVPESFTKWRQDIYTLHYQMKQVFATVYGTKESGQYSPPYRSPFEFCEQDPESRKFHLAKFVIDELDQRFSEYVLNASEDRALKSAQTIAENLNVLEKEYGRRPLELAPRTPSIKYRSHEPIGKRWYVEKRNVLRNCRFR